MKNNLRKFQFTGNRLTIIFYVPIFLFFRCLGAFYLIRINYRRKFTKFSIR